MVDSVSNSGLSQNLSQTNRSQNARNNERAEDERSKINPLDEVQISQEALDLAQAEEAAQKTAEETRQILQNSDETLSNDKKLVDELL